VRCAADALEARVPVDAGVVVDADASIAATRHPAPAAASVRSEVPA